jgi:lipopolysaccharide transport system permease protein
MTERNEAESIAVYSPMSSLRDPARFFREMVKDTSAASGLAMALARRDVSSMYRQSLLGYVWAFLPPLGTTAVFLFLRGGGAFDTGDPGMAYPVFVLIGTLLWQVFADSINGPLKSVTNARAMLTKIRFPCEALILSAFYTTLFNFVVRMLILIPALGWFTWNGTFQWNASALLLFPIGVLGIVLVGYAIGVLITPAGMLYNDVSMGLQTIMIFWMLVSPVVLVRASHGVVGQVMNLNPVTHVLDFTRNGLVGQTCDWTAFLIVTGLSVLGLLVGMVVYRVALPHAISRMGM